MTKSSPQRLKYQRELMHAKRADPVYLARERKRNAKRMAAYRAKNGREKRKNAVA